MDIFSHGLWAGAGSRLIGTRRGLNFWRAAFWGVFPDLFAFTIPFAWLIWNLIIGNPVSMPDPGNAEPVQGNGWPFELAHNLYNISHSLVVFAIVFGIVVLLARYSSRHPISLKLRWAPYEMGGWFLHILMDVPTHSYRFFPTPVFWPISEWKFDGISWADPSFLIIDYSLLAVIYLFFFIIKQKGGSVTSGKR